MYIAHRRRPPLAATEFADHRLQKAKQLIGTALEIPTGPFHAAKTYAVAARNAIFNLTE
jgi:hypothetical protein